VPTRAGGDAQLLDVKDITDGDPGGTKVATAEEVAAHLRGAFATREDIMPAKDTDIAPSRVQPAVPPKTERPAPLETIGFSPFRTLERFADDMTRLFDDFGVGRGWRRLAEPDGILTWSPRVDVTQHKGDLVVRVDLPGMKKDDVKVNVTEDALTIHGERHREQEEERDGVYRSERTYGAFYRTIALPPGTGTDQVKASFKDGVLEIRMPAAPSAKGRPVEIAG
jgi:HSP20 family protein